MEKKVSQKPRNKLEIIEIDTSADDDFVPANAQRQMIDNGAKPVTTTPKTKNVGRARNSTARTTRGQKTLVDISLKKPGKIAKKSQDVGRVTSTAACQSVGKKPANNITKEQAGGTSKSGLVNKTGPNDRNQNTEK